MNAISRPNPLTLIRLRRDGEPPLRFIGHQIARHDGHTPQAGLWHDFALYRCTGGEYVVEIVCRSQAGPTRCHAGCVDSLDAALTLFETHDPAQDLVPGLTMPDIAFDNPALSTAELVVQTARLHMARLEVERRYRIGVGSFLMSLGLLDL